MFTPTMFSRRRMGGGRATLRAQPPAEGRGVGRSAALSLPVQQRLRPDPDDSVNSFQTTLNPNPDKLHHLHSV